jgi:hypothetical protein
MLATNFGVIPSSASSGFWLSGWTYGKKITIPASQIDADLTNFPCTVILDTGNFTFANALSSGYDIRFTDGSLNQLKFERQEHSNITPRAVYHVKIPTVADAADTVFYMWYGNSGASDAQDKVNVWDANYKMVLHLGATLSDSTSNVNNGTATGTTVVDTAYGKGRSFNGSSDYVTLTALLNASAGTILAVVKPTDFQNYDKIIVDDGAGYVLFGKSAVTTGLGFGLYDTALKKVSTGITLDNGIFYSLTGVYSNGSAIKVFIDTTSYSGDTLTGNIGSVATALKLGKDQSYYLGATYTSVRISNIARSDAWVKAEALSVKNGLITITDI